MKDLLKKGRPINEYLNKNGSMKVDCFTCLHRYDISKAPIGKWLCSGGDKKHMECNPKYMSNDLSYILWEPRVSNKFLDDEEFLIK